ncbi:MULTISPECIES: hypothetical protein [Acinetobacter]|uniref:Uncharacterized protein n=1 Tax=Acinetobacter haemolyticus TaxID=29430 RepID=A0AAW4J513_ACIHA|nr:MULTISPECIES: hypothetical protein [Acinetobacter]MBN6533134.1 hypothetical protein [Acinetobacter pittii]MBO3657459.1 hypothetical protein [Acinetobacter haemolyticus]NAR98522.1 hypothetical protein [Acinetobacter haemolyticus]
MNNEIPYPLKLLATQVDPNLDQNWQITLQRLFAEIQPHQREIICQHILQQKKIHWNRKENSFCYIAKHDFHSLIENTHSPYTKILIKQIADSLDKLKTYDDIYQISDYLENILGQINQIDTEDDLDLQAQKQRILKEFIYAAAQIILEKDHIALPINHRHINNDVIKTFITEVFLKQQLLKYSFNILRSQQLREEKNHILKYFLYKQQKTRQLDIVKTSKYIFALAPSSEGMVNTFSIRRFLQEEKFEACENIYINAAILILEKIDDPVHQQHFEWQINHIITIDKQVNQYVSDIVRNIELYCHKELIPFLMAPLNPRGIFIEKLVEQRLIDFEQKLSNHVLEPIADALKHSVHHTDECHYLYINIKQILDDLIRHFMEFQSQPSIIFNKQVHLFIARLKSYATLLQKRHTDIFTVFSYEAWKQHHAEALEPTNLLKDLSLNSLQEYKDAFSELKENQRLLKQSVSFLNKLLNKPQKIKDNIIKLKEKTIQIKRNAHQEIIRMQRRFPSLIVYLEFESLISVNHKERHYAFPTGDNGITRLPILIEIPEDRASFDLQTICNSLNFDLSLANQKWLETI